MSTTTEVTAPVTSTPAPVAAKPDFKKQFIYGRKGMAILFTNPENSFQYASIKFTSAKRPLRCDINRINMELMKSKDVEEALKKAVYTGGIALIGDKPWTPAAKA